MYVRRTRALASARAYELARGPFCPKQSCTRRCARRRCAKPSDLRYNGTQQRKRALSHPEGPAYVRACRAMHGKHRSSGHADERPCQRGCPLRHHRRCHRLGGRLTVPLCSTKRQKGAARYAPSSHLPTAVLKLDEQACIASKRTDQSTATT